jgi:hypothetical protein
MATLRNVSSGTYNVGNTPPVIVWTVVHGDTASFRVYVTDDAQVPLNIPDWNILMQFKRPSLEANAGFVTDQASLILTLIPEPDADDEVGEFTVSLTAEESAILETGDIFDIELSTEQRQLVWTVAQGSMKILEDVTSV